MRNGKKPTRKQKIRLGQAGLAPENWLVVKQKPNGEMVMKHCMDKIMRLTITANKKYTKRTTLQELDVEIAALKVYLRVAFDLRYLPPKKYEVWSGMMVEIGKMVGGWIRSQREAAEPKKPDAEKRYCADCSEEIPEKAYKYSMEHFGRALCYKCQKKNRK